jgi:hypothetical protein
LDNEPKREAMAIPSSTVFPVILAVNTFPNRRNEIASTQPAVNDNP